ncbi:unnamed protein product, partial [Prunus brigantina]
MASSIEIGGAWSTMEDLQISHCPVSGNEMKFCHMWKKIHAEFCERILGSTRTEMTLSNRWKILNKELAKWRDALAKARDNHRSGENLSSEEPMPIGQKAAKVKKGSNSSTNTSTFLEEIARQSS